ncbi:MAG: sensor domain-containing diguanylate cyclase [Longimicrobiales bacterium]|nr:sensor domain-containing diguanylate cyclase [Longimicrobiales bacterium]
MQDPPPENGDAGRRQALHDLDLLGTGPDERFDRLTRLARHLFDTPLALLSLTGSDRKWIKSRIGLDPNKPPAELSFCSQAEMGEDLLIVPDASRDARFRDHPAVRDLPEIRFYAGCPVKGPDGNPLGTLCVIDHEPREIDEEDAGVLKDLAWMLEQELKTLSLATLDELTGLTNRRGFDAIAEHTIAMCRRVGEPATLLYFDLNEFKEINDTLGHNAGDRVLRSFAHHLKTTFRDSDVVARVGGDEFCVLLTSATTKDVDRPLSLLEGRLTTRGGEPGVGFSVGIASYDPARHTSVQALVNEADMQMYRDKRSHGGGRGRRDS